MVGWSESTTWFLGLYLTDDLMWSVNTTSLGVGVLLGGRGGSFGSSRRSSKVEWILTAVKTLSDMLFRIHWLTETHMQMLSHTTHSCSWVLRHIPLTANNATSPTFFCFSSQKHRFTLKYIWRYIHIKKKHTIKYQCRWSGLKCFLFFHSSYSFDGSVSI